MIPTDILNEFNTLLDYWRKSDSNADSAAKNYYFNQLMDMAERILNEYNELPKCDKWTDNTIMYLIASRKIKNEEPIDYFPFIWNYNWEEHKEWHILAVSACEQLDIDAYDHEKMLLIYNKIIPIADYIFMDKPPIYRAHYLSLFYSRKAYAEMILNLHEKSKVSAGIAISYFDQAMPHNILASYHMINNNHSDVIDELNKSIALNPDTTPSPWHYINRAGSYIVLDNLISAREDLLNVELSGRNAYWYLNMGLVLDKSGKTEDSIDFYEKACEGDTKGTAYVNLAAASIKLGKYKTANTYMDKALDLFGYYHPTVVWNKILALYYLEDYEQIVSILSNQKTDNLTWELLHILSESYLALNNYELSLTILNICLSKVKHYYSLQSLIINAIGYIYTKLGNPEKATAYFELAIRIDPSNTTAMNNWTSHWANLTDESINNKPEIKKFRIISYESGTFIKYYTTWYIALC